MPFYLDEIDVVAEVGDCKSVLIVPCRFCPAASMAVKSDEPYIEFPRRFLQTRAYERLIRKTRSALQAKGVNADVFRSHLVHQFVLCMWTSRRRKRLADVAEKYEALVVMGCEAAVETVRDAVKSTGCRVIQGMKTEGVMSIQPRFGLPGKIRLELQSVSPTLFLERAPGAPESIGACFASPSAGAKPQEVPKVSARPDEVVCSCSESRQSA